MCAYNGLLRKPQEIRGFSMKTGEYTIVLIDILFLFPPPPCLVNNTYYGIIESRSQLKCVHLTAFQMKRQN